MPGALLDAPAAQGCLPELVEEPGAAARCSRCGEWLLPGEPSRYDAWDRVVHDACRLPAAPGPWRIPAIFSDRPATGSAEQPFHEADLVDHQAAEPDAEE